MKDCHRGNPSALISPTRQTTGVEVVPLAGYMTPHAVAINDEECSLGEAVNS